MVFCSKICKSVQKNTRFILPPDLVSNHTPYKTIDIFALIYFAVIVERFLLTMYGNMPLSVLMVRAFRDITRAAPGPRSLMICMDPMPPKNGNAGFDSL
jgi:hypothetical protein